MGLQDLNLILILAAWSSICLYNKTGSINMYVCINMSLYEVLLNLNG